MRDLSCELGSKIQDLINERDRLFEIYYKKEAEVVKLKSDAQLLRFLKIEVKLKGARTFVAGLRRTLRILHSQLKHEQYPENVPGTEKAIQSNKKQREDFIKIRDSLLARRANMLSLPSLLAKLRAYKKEQRRLNYHWKKYDEVGQRLVEVCLKKGLIGVEIDVCPAWRCFREDKKIVVRVHSYNKRKKDFVVSEIDTLEFDLHYPRLRQLLEKRYHYNESNRDEDVKFTDLRDFYKANVLKDHGLDLEAVVFMNDLRPYHKKDIFRK